MQLISLEDLKKPRPKQKTLLEREAELVERKMFLVKILTGMFRGKFRLLRSNEKIRSKIMSNITHPVVRELVEEALLLDKQVFDDFAVVRSARKLSGQKRSVTQEKKDLKVKIVGHEQVLAILETALETAADEIFSFGENDPVFEEVSPATLAAKKEALDDYSNGIYKHRLEAFEMMGVDEKDAKQWFRTRRKYIRGFTRAERSALRAFEDARAKSRKRHLAQHQEICSAWLRARRDGLSAPETGLEMRLLEARDKHLVEMEAIVAEFFSAIEKLSLLREAQNMVDDRSQEDYDKVKADLADAVTHVLSLESERLSVPLDPGDFVDRVLSWQKLGRLRHVYCDWMIEEISRIVKLVRKDLREELEVESKLGNKFSSLRWRCRELELLLAHELGEMLEVRRAVALAQEEMIVAEEEKAILVTIDTPTTPTTRRSSGFQKQEETSKRSYMSKKRREQVTAFLAKKAEIERIKT